MTSQHLAPARTTPHAVSSRPWTTIAVAAAALMIGLEGWDAFHISDPQGAVIAMALFAAGIVWLSRRAGRAPAIFLGVLFALELILNFTIFGVLAGLAGLIACLTLTAAPPHAGDRPAA